MPCTTLETDTEDCPVFLILIVIVIFDYIVSSKNAHKKPYGLA